MSKYPNDAVLSIYEIAAAACDRLPSDDFVDEVRRKSAAVTALFPELIRCSPGGSDKTSMLRRMDRSDRPRKTSRQV